MIMLKPIRCGNGLESLECHWRMNFCQVAAGSRGIRTVFREAEKTASERIMELSWTAAFVGLYLNYETDQEFLPQFEKNVREITALLQMAPIKEGGRANE